MFTSKRKLSTPQKVDVGKRRELSWNMSDLSLDDYVFVCDEVESNQFDKSSTDAMDEDLKPEAMDVDENLRKLLNSCDFYVDIVSRLSDKPSVKSWHGLLGKIELSLRDVSEAVVTFLACLLDHIETFWLYVDVENCGHFIYIDLSQSVNALSASAAAGLNENSVVSCNDKIIYLPVSANLPAECFCGLQSKRDFCLKVSSCSIEHRTLSVNVFLLEPALVCPEFPSIGIKPRRCHATIQTLVGHFYGISSNDMKSKTYSKKHNVSELFAAVSQFHADQSLNDVRRVQHNALRPRLREYQKRAIRWMLFKETPPSSSLLKGLLHCLYAELTLVDGQTVFYNRHAGFLTRDRQSAMVTAPGGILADEMGLGKTVEILALILLHRREGLLPVEELPVVVRRAIDDHQKNRGKGKARHLNGKAGYRFPVETRLTETNSTPASDNEFRRENVGGSLQEIKKEEQFAETSSAAATGSQGDVVLLPCADDEDDDDKKTVASETKSAFVVMSDFPSPSSAVDASAVSSGAPLLQPKSDRVELSVEVSSSTVCLSDASFDQNSVDSCVTPSDRCVRSVDDCMTAAAAAAESDAGLSHSATVTADSDEVVFFDGDVYMEETVSVFSQSSGRQTSDKTTTTTTTKKKSTTKKSSTGRKKTDLILNYINEKTEDGSGLSPDSGVASAVESFDSEAAIVGVAATATTEDDEPSIECQCGAVSGTGSARHTVECQRCRSRQHAECVNYDLSDPFRGVYLCPHCHVVEPPVPSAATLIITPNSIAHQWVDEIFRHLDVSSINVLVYQGVNKKGYIQPQTLARQDIVLTSYETLRKEIDYVDLPHTSSENGRKFRNPKRFMAIPSPLIAVEWWRICLDEAQMVECTTTKTAEMVQRLCAINRWCVTGTPVQRGIDDLYGLFLFLGVDPYCVRQWWNALLYEPMCHGFKQPLYDAVSNVMWRTAKNDVLDQICLPLQTIEIHWLTFSPVEAHFYRQQYFECCNDAVKRLRQWTDNNMKLDSLDKYSLHQLLLPLVRLRQACCHPQAVRGHFMPLQKATMTMDELLTHLITKTRYDCEEAHRQMIFASTGLAGIHVIKEEFAEAVDQYREMLRSVDVHRLEIRTDPLQVLHIVHNLHELLSLNIPGIGQTLADSELKAQESQICTKYLEKKAAFLTTSKDAWTLQRNAVNEHHAKVTDDDDWWAELLVWFADNSLESALVNKVKDDVVQNVDMRIYRNNMSNKFQSISGLQYLLADQLQQLDASRHNVDSLLDRLCSTDPTLLVDDVIQCCLRDRQPIQKTTATKKRCVFCELDDLLNQYESKLFLSSKEFIDKEQNDKPGRAEETDNATDGPGTSAECLPETDKRQGTWADSDTEKALRSIVTFAKPYRAVKNLVESGLGHMKLFDLLKKEFRCLRPMWMALRERVCAIDEINMATTRMCLGNDNDKEPSDRNVIKPRELEMQRLKLVADRIVANNQLQTKKGQLKYLKNLKESKNRFEDGKNPDLCPVCQMELGYKWSVLHCGHCYCLPCIEVLIKDSRRRGSHLAVHCPVCRTMSTHADISYVSTVRSDAVAAASGVEVKGDHSTKIEGVVRCIINIQRADPEAKLLVFSTWQDVLDILANALTQNNLQFRSLNARQKFEENLHCFKSSSDVRILLLPVNVGANGLNLIEATHVLLVEPILNKAQELQAIGRIHRIGQTRPTVVHRFLVRGTIEERMHELLETVDVPLECHNSEQSSLTIGHLNQLFTENEVNDSSSSSQQDLTVDQ